MLRLNITCSQLFRVALCRGSARLSANAPRPPVGPAATEGKFLHQVYAREPFVGDLTGDQKYCVEFCNNKTEELVAQVFGGEQPHIYREYEFQRNGQYWGRCDFLAIRGTTALIIDPKFGEKRVEPAPVNWQLRGYIIGAKQDFIITRAVGAILQPRTDADYRCSVVEYDAPAIETAEKAIDRMLLEAELPDAPFNPTPDGCRYCPAKPICQAVKGIVAELATVHSSEIDNPAVMADYLRKARIVKEVLSSIEYHALDMAKRGQVPPGFELKDGKNRRTVTDTSKCYGALAGTLSPEAFAAACKVQVGELEKVFKDATGKTAKDASQHLKEILIEAGCLEIKQGEPTLVEE